MIILAHDGSLYGDWVARYALNFASGESDRKLLLLHVLDGKINRELVKCRFERLQEDCRRRQVDLAVQMLPPDNGVYRTLRHAIPPGQQNLLLCGTRTKQKNNSFLGGSVAARLLRTHQCPVLALRVVQPGRLGSPASLLLPLAGHRGGFVKVVGPFQRLTPSLQRVHMFRALHVHHLRHAQLNPQREQRLLAAGQSYLEAIARELEEWLPDARFVVERQVLIASDWPNAVLVQASRLKAQMLLLGVSERSLAHRFFHGDGIERVLRDSPCDVGIYRGP